MTKSEAVFRLKLHKHELTRQRVKTLYGQIQHGQPNKAMRGLDMILERRKKTRSGGIALIGKIIAKLITKWNRRAENEQAKTAVQEGVPAQGSGVRDKLQGMAGICRGTEQGI